MTLHSQVAFNFRNQEKGRECIPVRVFQRWTGEETRAMENWWLREMPGAGKTREQVVAQKAGKPNMFQRIRDLLLKHGELATGDFHRIIGGNRNSLSNKLAYYRDTGLLEMDSVDRMAIWSLPRGDQ